MISFSPLAMMFRFKRLSISGTRLSADWDNSAPKFLDRCEKMRVIRMWVNIWLNALHVADAVLPELKMMSLLLTGRCRET